MNDFFAILQQLSWGLTVGALTAAATALAQMAGLVGCLLVGGGCGVWWWRKKRGRSQE